MRRMIFIMLFSFCGILIAEAQRNSVVSSKIFKVKYKGMPVKEDSKPEFNKNDSSFNKKLSRQKKKENKARRKKARSNSKIRKMEVQHNKRSIELARKMELKEREAKK
jgi:hypothetical protein